MMQERHLDHNSSLVAPIKPLLLRGNKLLVRLPVATQSWGSKSKKVVLSHIHGIATLRSVYLPDKKSETDTATLLKA